MESTNEAIFKQQEIAIKGKSNKPIKIVGRKAVSSQINKFNSTQIKSKASLLMKTEKLKGRLGENNNSESHSPARSMISKKKISDRSEPTALASPINSLPLNKERSKKIKDLSLKTEKLKVRKGKRSNFESPSESVLLKNDLIAAISECKSESKRTISKKNDNLKKKSTEIGIFHVKPVLVDLKLSKPPAIKVDKQASEGISIKLNRKSKSSAELFKTLNLMDSKNNAKQPQNLQSIFRSTQKRHTKEKSDKRQEDQIRSSDKQKFFEIFGEKKPKTQKKNEKTPKFLKQKKSKIQDTLQIQHIDYLKASSFNTIQPLTQSAAIVKIQRWFRSILSRKIQVKKYQLTRSSANNSFNSDINQNNWVNILEPNVLVRTSEFVEEFRSRLLKKHSDPVELIRRKKSVSLDEDIKQSLKQSFQDSSLNEISSDSFETRVERNSNTKKSIVPPLFLGFMNEGDQRMSEVLSCYSESSERLNESLEIIRCEDNIHKAIKGDITDDGLPTGKSYKICELIMKKSPRSSKTTESLVEQSLEKELTGKISNKVNEFYENKVKNEEKAKKSNMRSQKNKLPMLGLNNACEKLEATDKILSGQPEETKVEAEILYRLVENQCKKQEGSKRKEIVTSKIENNLKSPRIEERKKIIKKPKKLPLDKEKFIKIHQDKNRELQSQNIIERQSSISIGKSQNINERQIDILKAPEVLLSPKKNSHLLSTLEKSPRILAVKNSPRGKKEINSSEPRNNIIKPSKTSLKEDTESDKVEITQEHAEISEKSCKTKDFLDVSKEKKNEPVSPFKRIIENYPRSPKASPSISPAVSSRLYPANIPDFTFEKYFNEKGKSEKPPSKPKSFLTHTVSSDSLSETCRKTNSIMKITEKINYFFTKSEACSSGLTLSKNLEKIIESPRMIEKLKEKTPGSSPRVPLASEALPSAIKSPSCILNFPLSLPITANNQIYQDLELISPLNTQNSFSECSESCEPINFINLINQNCLPEDTQQADYCYDSPLKSISTYIEEIFPVIILSEISQYLELVSFQSVEKEVDPSIGFILEYLEFLGKELKANEAEILESINTPFAQDSLLKLSDLQNSENKSLLKIPALELILPSELSTVLKIKLSSLNSISKQIYIQMIFDCVNVALNYIRPLGVAGFPDPWIATPKTLFGESQIEIVLSKIAEYLLKWTNCKAGYYPKTEAERDEDILHCIREEKLSSLLCMDAYETENCWSHCNDEETQLKLITSESIFEQLLGETLEILNNPLEFI